MAVWDGKHTRGDDRTIPFTVRDSNGVAIILTGAKAWFTVKEAVDDDVTDANAAFTRATANAAGGDNDQILFTDAVGGKGEIYIVPINTNSMSLGSYLADLQVELASGKLYTVWARAFVLEADVTRRAT